MGHKTEFHDRLTEATAKRNEGATKTGKQRPEDKKRLVGPRRGQLSVKPRGDSSMKERNAAFNTEIDDDEYSESAGQEGYQEEIQSACDEYDDVSANMIKIAADGRPVRGCHTDGPVSGCQADRPVRGCDQQNDRPAQGCKDNDSTKNETCKTIDVDANATNLDDTLFVIDTACKGGNVVKDPALLDQLTIDRESDWSLGTPDESHTWGSFHLRAEAS
jgi:hypothetical protein